MKLHATASVLLLAVAALASAPAHADKLKVFACEPEWGSLVTELVTREALQSLNWSGTAAQVTTALQQHAALLGFPDTTSASIAANDSGLRQWLKDRAVGRDDWVCLNPNLHGSGRSKLTTVFAFRDPDVAFEFRLTFT